MLLHRTSPAIQGRTTRHVDQRGFPALPAAPLFDRPRLLPTPDAAFSGWLAQISGVTLFSTPRRALPKSSYPIGGRTTASAEATAATRQMRWSGLVSAKPAEPCANISFSIACVIFSTT